MIAQKFTYQGFEIRGIGHYRYEVFKDETLITTCSSVISAQRYIVEYLKNEIISYLNSHIYYFR